MEVGGGVVVVREYGTNAEMAKFFLPMREEGFRRDEENCLRGAAIVFDVFDVFELERAQKGCNLHRFSKTHVIGENATHVLLR